VPDAVVIGAGPNGLVAANLLADAGWDVLVLEAQDEPGGAMRSGALTLPGYVHDRFSSFYPLAVASPVMRALALEDHGVRWRRHSVPVAHPARDGSVAYVSQDLEETEAGLDAFAPGDGAAFRRLIELWDRVGEHLLEALVSPFPPVRGASRIAAALGARGVLDFARFGLLPVRRCAGEEFRGEGAARLLAGNALHADLSPEAPGGALYGWVLCGLAQRVGFPVPEGGSGQLAAALVARLRSRGGQVECGERVTQVLVRGGRATGVRTAGGREVQAGRAVLADVGAPALFQELLEPRHVPERVRRAIERFQYDNATFKVDWALAGPVPWPAEPARRAGTIHVTEGVDALTRASTELTLGRVPAEPFLIAGQYAAADPTRQPPGTETFWSYTHVPQQVRGDAGGDGLTGSWDIQESERFADRMEGELEAVAPGFRALVRGRSVTTPHELQAADANLVNGALNGGTAQLHQQLVFRPVPGLGRAETPVAGLYLASASAHPGGGVHGGPGAIAARAARREAGELRRVAARVAGAAVGRGRP